MNGEDIRLVLAGEVQHDERGRGIDDLLNLAAEHSPFDDPDFRDEAVLFLADSMYHHSFPPKMRAYMESWLDKIAKK